MSIFSIFFVGQDNYSNNLKILPKKMGYFTITKIIARNIENFEKNVKKKITTECFHKSLVNNN